MDYEDFPDMVPFLRSSYVLSDGLGGGGGGGGGGGRHYQKRGAGGLFKRVRECKKSLKKNLAVDDIDR